MNLIFNSILLVDLTNKEAKKIEFAPGKNMLTSNGNHYGKSVIMKSLYYTLGAEVYFPNPIKSLNYMTILRFTLEDKQYIVGRLNSMFVVFRNSKFIKKYHNVGDFGDFLSDLFKFEIELVGKDAEGTIEKCPPAFFYLPYYIDQENGWSTNSYSFDRMTQFDMPQRKDSYFFHFGVLDSEYVKQNKHQKANSKKISKLLKDNEKYKTVIETLKMGLDDTQMAFEIKDLQAAIPNRKDDIDSIFKDIAKCRKELVEAEDMYQRLLNEKEVLAKYIKKNDVTPTEKTDVVECPRCGLFFEQALSVKMEQVYLLESLNDDYTKVTTKAEKAERKIKKLNEKYESCQKKLKEYENSLGDEQGTYDTYLKAKTTKKLLEDYRKKIAQNEEFVSSLKDSNRTIRMLLKEYQQSKSKANITYLSVLHKNFGTLDIPSNQVPRESEPGSFIEASGAYGPRCKIAQALSFLETQKSISNEIITFPLVIDSPNVLEQDKDHLESVLKMLLTWNVTDNQIIVASIEGKELAEQLSGVKVIQLDNEVNHIMSKDEYNSLRAEIDMVITSF